MSSEERMAMEEGPVSPTISAAHGENTLLRYAAQGILPAQQQGSAVRLRRK